MYFPEIVMGILIELVGSDTVGFHFPLLFLGLV
jgi:hypothetical protein